MKRTVLCGIMFVPFVLSVQSVTATEQEKAASFRPPSAAARRKAIGSTGSLSPALRKVFDPRVDFDPIPKPGPGLRAVRSETIHAVRGPGQRWEVSSYPD